VENKLQLLIIWLSHHNFNFTSSRMQHHCTLAVLCTRFCLYGGLTEVDLLNCHHVPQTSQQWTFSCGVTWNLWCYDTQLGSAAALQDNTCAAITPSTLWSVHSSLRPHIQTCEQHSLQSEHWQQWMYKHLWYSRHMHWFVGLQHVTTTGHTAMPSLYEYIKTQRFLMPFLFPFHHHVTLVISP
jgi:hypothetical protein